MCAPGQASAHKALGQGRHEDVQQPVTPKQPQRRSSRPIGEHRLRLHQQAPARQTQHLRRLFNIACPFFYYIVSPASAHRAPVSIAALAPELPHHQLRTLIIAQIVRSSNELHDYGAKGGKLAIQKL